jgi:deoxyribonucleoside regulator
MSTPENIRLLTKIATLYYKSQLSQHEVAQRLGLSRQTVGRLLQRALDVGIVRIEIQSQLSYVSELELQLEAAFNLMEVVVVSPPADTPDAIRSAIGQAAAEFLQRRVKDGDILGVVSGSTTVYEFAQHLNPARMPNLTVVSMTGSAPRSPSPTNFESIAYLVGKTLGGKTVLLPAPAFVDRPEIKTSLYSDSIISGIIDLAHRSNISIVGIGPISEEASPYRQGFVEAQLLKTMQEEGCVGEICGHAFNLQGESCSPELSARAIAIELENLREKQISVALAGGLNKLDAIWGALHGRYLNVLVTDEDTALALLARVHEQKGGDAGRRMNQL